MKVRLTDRELSALGYDEPAERDDPETVRAIVRKTGRKPEELTDAERSRLTGDVSMLNNTGTDPADARTATRLMNKVLDSDS